MKCAECIASGDERIYDEIFDGPESRSHYKDPWACVVCGKLLRVAAWLRKRRREK